MNSHRLEKLKRLNQNGHSLNNLEGSSTAQHTQHQALSKSSTHFNQGIPLKAEREP